MRAFYLAYSQDTILPPAVGELKDTNKNAMPKILTSIAWTHNYIIIKTCKNVNERLFYILQANNNAWTKNVLIHQIENQTFQKTLINHILGLPTYENIY